MAHQHVHIHTHNHALTSLNTVFIVCIVINLLFVIIEAGVGFLFNSLGLLSDAGHNLSDVFSLLLSLFAYRMAKRHSTDHFTYGYKKSTVLVSLLNAIILLIAVGAIIIESIYINTVNARLVYLIFYKIKHLRELLIHRNPTRTSIGRCGILDGWNRNSCQRHHGMVAYEEPKA